MKTRRSASAESAAPSKRRNLSTPAASSQAGEANIHGNASFGVIASRSLIEPCGLRRNIPSLSHVGMKRPSLPRRETVARVRLRGPPVQPASSNLLGSPCNRSASRMSGFMILPDGNRIVGGGDADRRSVLQCRHGVRHGPSPGPAARLRPIEAVCPWELRRRAARVAIVREQDFLGFQVASAGTNERPARVASGRNESELTVRWAQR